jgi:oligopeptide transport system substrate-binding protein
MLKNFCKSNPFLLIALVLVITSLALLLSSGAFKMQNSQSPRFKTNTLRINLGCEPPSLDWAKATDAASFDVVSNIMVGLTAYTKDLSCSAACAESWQILDHGKRYIFHLRPNIYWSDGKPLTAYDFQYAWRRLLNPNTAAPYAFFLYDIENAFAYNQGKLKNADQLGCKAINENTFEVRLNRPIAYFLYLTAFCPTFPQRQDIIERYGNKWIEPGHLVCNGPFLLTKWQHEYKIELAANPFYYASKPSLKTIEMFMIPEQSTAFALYENNQLDFIDNRSFPTSEIERYRKYANSEYKDIALLRVGYLGFNIDKKPFDNVKVRRALSLAIDREHICRILRHGEKPIANLIPSPLLGHSDFSSEQSYNPKLAKNLLAQAGYPEGKNFPKTFLLYPHREDTRLLVEAMQDELKRNLNIHVELLNQEWQVYLQTLRNNTPPIYRYAWGADYPDPDTFMNLFTSHNGNNNTHWSNKTYDDLVSLAGCEANPVKRASLYKQADYLLCKQYVPIIPVNTAAQNMLIKPWVHGIIPNALDLQFFSQVSVGD